jgi:O-antigen/teichoic acid export membrane protein
MQLNMQHIAKNTFMLYFRHILIILVNLYTVRVILNTLGVEDYGLYNVVAGVVIMFNFINSSMAGATQRYFSFLLGRNEFDRLEDTFSICLIIYILIAIIILLLTETIGFWFINKVLIIPQDRNDAVYIVYQFSIFSFLSAIIATPFMALIISYEDMSIYAYVSIIESTLKLGIVFVLQIVLIDKLQLYSILIFIVNSMNTVIYIIICKIKYHKCRIKMYWNKDVFNEIASYSMWNLLGTCAGIFKYQLVNILLNQFFNPIVIASRSISISINNAVSSFYSNFSTAMRPPIIKRYAAGKNIEIMLFYSAKFTYFLVYIFILPLILEMNFVLFIWLDDPPEYACLFSRLILIDALIDSIGYQFNTIAQATGKIRLYQSISSVIILLNLPISYIVLKFGYPAYSVMIIAICIACITFIARLLIVKYLITYSLIQFIKRVIIPIFNVSILSLVIPLSFFFLIKESFFRLCLIICISILTTSTFIYKIGLNDEERQYVKIILSHSGISFSNKIRNVINSVIVKVKNKEEEH